MPDIKKFPNIIEAMKYLEPGHLLTQCLERDGVAINYQSNMPVSMPDGRIALLCPSPNPNYYRGEKCRNCNFVSQIDHGSGKFIVQSV